MITEIIRSNLYILEFTTNRLSDIHRGVHFKTDPTNGFHDEWTQQ